MDSWADLRLVRQQRRDAVQHLAEAVHLGKVAALKQVLWSEPSGQLIRL